MKSIITRCGTSLRRRRFHFCLVFWVVLILASVGGSPYAIGQIVADHTVVDRYVDIPPFYIDRVKTMLVSIAGESHSAGYRRGLELLAAQDARFAVTVFSDSSGPSTRPYNPTDPRLRLGSFIRSWDGNWDWWVGEELYFISRNSIARTKSEVIAYCHDQGWGLAAIGFGWCWDMTNGGVTEDRDADHNVRWYGRIGNLPPASTTPWGLDADDQSLTETDVCLDTYLSVVEELRLFCRENGYATVPLFTTGPVDENGATEAGFQREIKHDAIRAFVAQDADRVLFDYADILCYNDGGQKNMATWNDNGTPRTHAQIHPVNDPDETAGHISNTGALRLAKAMWWILARIAGWDGNPEGEEIQSFTLQTGWNWISFNVLPADRSLHTVFGGVIGQVEQVKTQSQSALRLNGNWVGDLADMDGIQTGKMYKVHVNVACILTVSGTRIASATPISLVGGWNWIAYYPDAPLPVGQSLTAIAPQVQQAKSQTQSAIVQNGSWLGDLTQLEPGKGYTVLLSGPGTVVYPGN